MSEYRKASPDDLYYLTLNVEGWVDIFSRQQYKDIIVENLKYCQEKEGLEIYAYVIMTNHLHLVARRKDKDLTELLGRFKSHTAKKIIELIKGPVAESRREWMLYLFEYFAKKNKQYSNYHFWHYSNHPTQLFTPEVVKQKTDYIHNNPVRAGIVLEPYHYLYSSACADSPLKVLEY
ncbi:MAG: transposase [Opitutaceae bacterium]|nr:transposase [Cytophagales bacterium]